ncbi:C4-dicarboxylate TRAP transporter substrate-binding protein [Saccharomonospora sp. NPDC006951]
MKSIVGPSRPVRVIAAIMCCVLVLSGCAGGHRITGGSLAELRPVTLRVANFTAASADGPFNAFAAEVERRTGGKITFESYWGGSLLTSEEMAQGVRGGIADIGMFGPEKYPSEYPMSNWLTHLNSLVEPRDPLGLMQGFAAITEFVLTDEPLTEYFRERDLKILFTYTPITNYHLACKTPVRTLEEARGKRVRSGGTFTDGDIEAMGMVPVNLPTGDIYESLQRGVIDCTVAMPKFMVAYGIAEVAKHYTEVPITGYSQYQVMNLGVWESLPPDAQRAITDSLGTWYEHLLTEEGIGYQRELYAEAPAEYGVRFHEPAPDMVEAVRAEQAAAVAQLPSVAPEGVADPHAAIERYRAVLDDWKGRLTAMGYADPALSDPGADIDLGPYLAEVESTVFDRYLR